MQIDAFTRRILPLNLECKGMREDLMILDKTGSGRVPLDVFLANGDEGFRETQDSSGRGTHRALPILPTKLTLL